MDYKIIVTASAEKDLNDIADYIAFGLKEPETALKQIKRIADKIYELETMPKKYAVLADEYLSSRGYRMSKCDNYLIFYRIEERKVYIIRVLYSRREWTEILKL